MNMARHASTYRRARRMAWQANNAMSQQKESWSSYNAKEVAWNKADAHYFGPVQSRYVGARAARSKYMPHIGAKQRAKGLARTA